MSNRPVESVDSLNNLCNRNENGWCEYCQACAPKDRFTDDFVCIALEHELQNQDYYSDENENCFDNNEERGSYD